MDFYWMFTSKDVVLKTSYKGKKHCVTMGRTGFEKYLNHPYDKNKLYEMKKMRLKVKTIRIGNRAYPWLPSERDILEGGVNQTRRTLYSGLLIDLKREHRILVHQRGYPTYIQSTHWGPASLSMDRGIITQARMNYEDLDSHPKDPNGSLLLRYNVVDPRWYDQYGLWISSEPIYLMNEDITSIMVGPDHPAYKSR